MTLTLRSFGDIRIFQKQINILFTYQKKNVLEFSTPPLGLRFQLYLIIPISIDDFNLYFNLSTL